MVHTVVDYENGCAYAANMVYGLTMYNRRLEAGYTMMQLLLCKTAMYGSVFLDLSTTAAWVRRQHSASRTVCQRCLQS
jgi:hypothetical protein